MAARDIFHRAVKQALINDGWTITNDPPQEVLMDKLTRYRHLIEEVLREYSQYRPSYGQVEVEQIIDPVHDHYQLLTVGWNDYRRIHGTLFHIDIKDEKIWIQYDGTDR